MEGGQVKVYISEKEIFFIDETEMSRKDGNICYS